MYVLQNTIPSVLEERNAIPLISLFITLHLINVQFQLDLRAEFT